MLASPSHSLMAEMNVTPFVDVALVLLIIFMVLTPTMIREIDLPITKDPLTVPETDRQVRILVFDTSTLAVNGEIIRTEQLESMLRERFDPLQPVVVKAPRAGIYGEVEEILATCREAGFENVVLAAAKS